MSTVPTKTNWRFVAECPDNGTEVVHVDRPDASALELADPRLTYLPDPYVRVIEYQGVHLVANVTAYGPFDDPRRLIGTLFDTDPTPPCPVCGTHLEVSAFRDGEEVAL